MFRSAAIIFAALLCAQAIAQQGDDAGPHARQERLQPGAQVNKPLNRLPAYPKAAQRVLTRNVMGYHPYWRSDANIAAYRFDFMTHVVYFSAGLDPNTGAITTSRDWKTTPLVEAAHAAGCKVQLCVTNFGAGNNLRLLQNPAARDTLITQLIRLVAERGGDGINLDFESMPVESRGDLVSFCRDLDTRLEAAIPGAEISSAMPAVDWDGAWDVAELAKHIDLFFIMCYDYYWSGATSAGPVSPIQGSSYNITRTLNWYIDQGVPKQQILMGVPYYGFDWPVVSDQMNAATTEKGTAYIYSSVKNALNLYDRLWSDRYLNPWYKYETASSWRQAWYDDAESLGLKYDLVLSLDIGGAGIWALSYDNGHGELWQLIEDKFTVPLGVSIPESPASISLDAPWPNPAGPQAAFVRMSYRIDHPGQPVTLRVFDVLGREVYVTMLQNAAQTGVVEIPAAALPHGFYTASATGSSATVRRRFLITR